MLKACRVYAYLSATISHPSDPLASYFYGPRAHRLSPATVFVLVTLNFIPKETVIPELWFSIQHLWTCRANKIGMNSSKKLSHFLMPHIQRPSLVDVLPPVIWNTSLHENSAYSCMWSSPTPCPLHRYHSRYEFALSILRWRVAITSITNPNTKSISASSPCVQEKGLWLTLSHDENKQHPSNTAITKPRITRYSGSSKLHYTIIHSFSQRSLTFPGTYNSQ
jgi:hypothetical protein